MAKKKATPKKQADAPQRRPVKKKVHRAAAESVAAAPVGLAHSSAMHVYRHEIQENPDNAPLIVEIPIAEGRGNEPPRPSFVAFTAEMSEEYWQDQFAFRLVSLSSDSVRVMISRVDKGSSELAWGVKLIVHVLVIDAG